jgi:hypothetical protein
MNFGVPVAERTQVGFFKAPGDSAILYATGRANL